MARKSPLGLLNLSLELAHSPVVLGDIDIGLLLVLLDEVINDSVVEVLTTKMSVTSSSQDLKDTVFNREERNIESTTTKVVDDNLRLMLASSVKTVS